MALFGLPLIPSSGPLFWVASPMVLSMISSDTSGIPGTNVDL